MEATAACMCSDKEKDSVRALQSPLEKNTQVQLQSKINLPTEFRQHSNGPQTGEERSDSAHHVARDHYLGKILLSATIIGLFSLLY